jgi:2-hydroxychromene-2-carboxylate isomerase
MTSHIDFYFDFTSPYAYLASTRIDALAARYGREVRWHPVLLAALSEATGVKLSPFVPAKWDYVQKDLARAARRLDMPFSLPPAFPQLWLNPPRAMLWIRERHGDEVARAFARSCFKTAFGHGTDIGSIDVVADLAARVGVNPAALREGVNDPAIKAALKAGIETAVGKGVFGVPYLVADGEAFWGGDRLDCLEEALAAAEALSH